MKILLIDEEKESMHYYILALKNDGVEVAHMRKADEAMQAVNQEGNVYKLIVLDSAMPPGNIYKNENTEDGTLTGGLLFRDIRKVCPNVPILILTNFFGLDWIQNALKDKRVRGDRKISLSPSKLVEIVREMIEHS
jgi:DNA-binding NtrC family response regulator